ncbi:YegS/Rv2252/BmrU family lipid kinase [Heliobacterium undosum]|uniref:YegS/Rv2252/BmrU family lipid kinase n=1 Tax=Heliomicrobium undosum TaxID=121734 RepID=A0A845L697_9FIRM|nr:YegS/Rv2252/BmrU family lipid kinase [Heliomicrobium undosum]MZP31226.1 YegS/Rv2252/BmrU family lipid kinase [Heliomicrobium undosum]
MPKRMKLIYNPEAGVGAFRRHLDRAIAIFQEGGWQVLAHRTREAPGDTADAAQSALAEGCSAVVAVGGDGTLHQVVNGLMRLSQQGKEPPKLGIIPAGTANDLASFLRLPRDVEACCQIIVQGKTRVIDVGRLGSRFFLNVASGGLMTDVSHKVAQPLKHNIGKLAYYLKALEQLPEFRPFELIVETPDGGFAYSGETLLFLVMNGAGAGSFTTLAPSARLDDGQLDLLVFRACSISEFVGLFVRVLQGEHIRSPLVTYHQAAAFRLSGSPEMETDLDGEVGPSLPWEIRVCQAGLTVFSPS